jgi:bacterioferritin
MIRSDPIELKATESHTMVACSKYGDVEPLARVLEANPIAERVAIEASSQTIALIGGKDSTTRRRLEDIVSDEQEQAEELKDWLAD